MFLAYSTWKDILVHAVAIFEYLWPGNMSDNEILYSKFLGHGYFDSSGTCSIWCHHNAFQ